MAEEGSTSVRRAIAILVALGSGDSTERGGVGVVEIARLLGREKTQVSRTLKILNEAGLVDRDPETQGYRLGWRLVALAANAGEQRLLAEAPAVLRRLVSVSGERAHLSVLSADGVLTVLSESPKRAVQAVGWVGRIVPVHCTSSGRALLFDRTDEEVRELLAGTELSRPGPNAPAGPKSFIERLREARQRGYVLVDEEFEPGLVAAAAPVRDVSGQVVAAVNISAPKFRLDHGLPLAGRHVLAAANQLSQTLGAPATTGPARQARSSTRVTRNRNE